MRRKWNPDFIRRLMEKDALRGVEVPLVATGGHFGLSADNTGKFREQDMLTADLPEGYDAGMSNYRGWAVESKLYCVRCWSAVQGVPRDVLRRNRCPACACRLYPDEDAEWLDRMGFWIYEHYARRYTELACRSFPELIAGKEHLCVLKFGKRVWGVRLETGFQRDHVFSVRQGFECDVAASIVSSPPNIRVIPSHDNLAKKARSVCSLDELLRGYGSFCAAHPEWSRIIEKSDEADAPYPARDG